MTEKGGNHNMNSPTLTHQDILQLFAQTDARISASFAETTAKFAETAARLNDTERLIKDLSKKFGHFGNRLGEFVEEMVRPAAVRLLRERGIQVTAITRNYECRHEEDSFEIDLPSKKACSCSAKAAKP